jgi:hypothetical protein
MNVERRADFLNEPVYPDSIPMSIPAGYKWVFAREVALSLLGKQLHSDPKSVGLHRLTNDQLGQQLVEMKVLYPEYLGGVVDDGEPNGIMPFPIK